MLCRNRIFHDVGEISKRRKKPDGFFQILTLEDLRKLIIDRSVCIIYGESPQTEIQLNKYGIKTVRDVYNNNDAVIRALGNQGQHVIDLANGIDNRRLATPAKSQSLGIELTFQQNISDREYLRDVLRLIARELSFQIRIDRTYIKIITLKITFMDMYRRPLTEIAMLGVSESVDVIRESAVNVREVIGSDGIMQTKFKKSSFSPYPTAYVDVRLEDDHKRKYALECDLTFWAVQFFTLVEGARI